MKQFNLEEYLKNPSKKVVTRDGRKVTRFLCTDAKGDYPIVALVEKFSGSEMPISYTKEGENRIGAKSVWDLFFAPEKHEGWVIISKLPLTDSFEISPEIFATKEEAVRVWEDNPGIKCSIIKIEWEVEQWPPLST